jgi:hypothetical protein
MESLALDQAPLNRMSGSGDRRLCGSAAWPHVSDKDNDNNDINRTNNREYIRLLRA